jgi:hypothetical protein
MMHFIMADAKIQPKASSLQGEFVLMLLNFRHPCESGNDGDQFTLCSITNGIGCQPAILHNKILIPT